MTRKIFHSFLFAGLISGFLFGLLSTTSYTGVQNYLPQKMYWLILNQLANRLNQGTAAALVLALSLFFILFILTLLWKKVFTIFVEIKITKKKDIQPWVRGLWILFLISLSILLFLKYHQRRIQMFLFLSGQIFILFSLSFFLFSKKKTFLATTQKMKSIWSLRTLRKAAVACMVFLVTINLINISHRQFFKPNTPNVLLIVADTLRADHLNCYGYPQPTSPTIDQFAETGILFEKHMSNSPWTKPSMGTLFTSFYPHEHRAFTWLDNLYTKCLTLAEVFQNRNYKTFAIQTNPCISAHHNFSQGYQEYMDIPMENGGKVTDTFIAWLEKNQKKPFFAYLHFMDTHMPYNASEEFSRIFQLDNNVSSEPSNLISLDIRILTELGISLQEKKSVIELYDESVRYFDFIFERILQHLKRQNLLKNTIVILTSDHGEEFWDHESFGHGHTLYNELIHVPLIIHCPHRLSPKRIPVYTQHLDFFPTLLSLAGIKIKYEPRGKEMTPLLLNQEKDRDAVVFFEAMLSGKEKRGIVKDGWKLIENTDFQSEGTGATLGDLENFRNNIKGTDFELYDLKQDFSERINHVAKLSALADVLKKNLLMIPSSGIEVLHQDKKNTRKKLEGLRTLGYIK